MTTACRRDHATIGLEYETAKGILNRPIGHRKAVLSQYFKKMYLKSIYFGIIYISLLP